MKLFRKIGQKYIVGKKFGKYLLYALGEVILIVVGILIALSIESKLEFDREREEERQLLIQLRSEFELNLEELELAINMRNDIIKASEKLLLYFENGVGNVALDSLSKLFGAVQFEPTFDPVEGVSVEILNTGKMGIFENDEIKSWITKWPSLLTELEETERLMYINVNDRFQPYLDANYDKRKYWKESDNLGVIDSYSKSEISQLKISSNLSRETFTNIFQDLVISNFLIRTARHGYIANKVSQDIHTQIEMLFTLIDNELKYKND